MPSCFASALCSRALSPRFTAVRRSRAMRPYRDNRIAHAAGALQAGPASSSANSALK
ncbi:hypothetical protein BSIN_4665 [Burkholderia singularis]|uniref:Uncharacterized protein n=1 Tax=Burkholderia singularis TaxID=1503053 RepID=A0A238H9L0_9BURK|nr:hypothetical protein BSIN_4665 [Burkholderia singularis]